jgi:hypothetical protein
MSGEEDEAVVRRILSGISEQDDGKPLVATLLDPVHVPPAMQVVDGVPTVGVISRMSLESPDSTNTVILEGLQRFSVVDLYDRKPNGYREALVRLIGDSSFGTEDDMSGLQYATRIMTLPESNFKENPLLKAAILEHGVNLFEGVSDVAAAKMDPYEALIDAVRSSDSLMNREMLGFAVAAALTSGDQKLTKAERLALLITDDGTGRLEWLLKKKLKVPGSQ